jgi:hypothetical protein
LLFGDHFRSAQWLDWTLRWWVISRANGQGVEGAAVLPSDPDRAPWEIYTVLVDAGSMGTGSGQPGRDVDACCAGNPDPAS